MIIEITKAKPLATTKFKDLSAGDLFTIEGVDDQVYLVIVASGDTFPPYEYLDIQLGKYMDITDLACTYDTVVTNVTEKFKLIGEL